MTTKRAKSLLLAMSIGDGTVHKDRPELQIRHELQQKDYCGQKAKLLGDCLGRTIHLHQATYGRYDCVRFSLSHPYLRFVRRWLYKDDQKRLTLGLLRRLTDEAIALWYMDDGRLYTKKRHGIPHACEVVMATCCPTREEAHTVCAFFSERYGVKMTTKKMKGRFFIRCGTHNARHLLSILAPYAMSGMEYKFQKF